MEKVLKADLGGLLDVFGNIGGDMLSSDAMKAKMAANPAVLKDAQAFGITDLFTNSSSNQTSSANSNNSPVSVTVTNLPQKTDDAVTAAAKEAAATATNAATTATAVQNAEQTKGAPPASATQAQTATQANVQTTTATNATAAKPAATNATAQVTEQMVDQIGGTGLKPSIKGFSDTKVGGWLAKMGNSKVGQMMGGATGIAGAATALGDAASAALGPKSEYSGEKGKITQGMDAAYDKLESMAGNIPVYGKFIQAGMMANKLAGKVAGKLGAGTDGMTTQDAILGSSFLQMTPLGLINGAFGKKTKEVNYNNWQDEQQRAQLEGGYAGTEDMLAKVAQKANKKYGLFSTSERNSANRQIDKANDTAARLLELADTTETRRLAESSMAQSAAIAYQNSLGGGYQDIRIGRIGMKLTTQLNNARRILDIKQNKQTETFKSGGILEPPNFLLQEWVPDIKQDNTEVSVFKAGGSLNLIPEGALHARLNKMEGGGKDFTKKGIPVIDGDGNQQAEIECNEIIFRKEATDKLEALWKDGSDEAAIEAGKLLVDEIFNKTEDRTGLIKDLTGEEEHHLDITETKQPEVQPKKLEKKELGGVLELNHLSDSEKDLLLELLIEKANRHD